MVNIEFIGGFGGRENICKEQLPCGCVCISYCAPANVSETDGEVVVDEDSDAQSEAQGG